MEERLLENGTCIRVTKESGSSCHSYTIGQIYTIIKSARNVYNDDVYGYVAEDNNGDRGNYIWRSYFEVISEPILKKEECKTMAHVNSVETKHYVNGTDIKLLGVDQQVELITNTQKRIDELSALSTKTDSISKEIERLVSNLKDVVALFNNSAE